MTITTSILEGGNSIVATPLTALPSQDEDRESAALIGKTSEWAETPEE
jgi:hypothetical protein